MFRQNLFPVGFKFPLSPPLDFYRLRILGDQTKKFKACDGGIPTLLI